jgi:hypothetical protein
MTTTHESGLGTPDYESGGQEFESLRARQQLLGFNLESVGDFFALDIRLGRGSTGATRETISKLFTPADRDSCRNDLCFWMPTFWQSVEVPERCFLHEALLWLAFQRLPVAFYNDRNEEIRSASEYEGPELESPGGPLTDEECKRADIPSDPHFHHLVDENPEPLKTYQDLEPQYGHDEAMQRIKDAMDKEASRLRACVHGMADTLRRCNGVCCFANLRCFEGWSIASEGAVASIPKRR